METQDYTQSLQLAKKLERRAVSFCKADVFHLFANIHFVSGWDEPDNPSGTNLFVMREDDASLGLARGKMRKWSSLLQWIDDNGWYDVALIGGANSNHLVSATQLLLQQIGPPKIFVRKNSGTIGTNAFLLKLLIPDSYVQEIEAEDWENVHELANDWKKDHLNGIVIPEGAFMKYALPGALSLATTLVQASSTTKIYVDAGTGFSAAALILGLSYCKHPAKVEVVHMAEGKFHFEAVLARLRDWWEDLFQEQAPPVPAYGFHRPKVGKSFGSCPQSIIDFSVDFARKTGLITDPIYSAKLFQTAIQDLKENPFEGNALIIHSGGSESLLGFKDQYQKSIDQEDNKPTL